MGLLSWFDAREAKACGTALAELIIRELPAKDSVKEKKFADKAEKTLLKVMQQVADFKHVHKPNTYQKAQLGNAFLWTLKDGGVNEAYASELTEWLSLKL